MTPNPLTPDDLARIEAAMAAMRATAFEVEAFYSGKVTLHPTAILNGQGLSNVKNAEAVGLLVENGPALCAALRAAWQRAEDLRREADERLELARRFRDDRAELLAEIEKLHHYGAARLLEMDRVKAERDRETARANGYGDVITRDGERLRRAEADRDALRAEVAGLREQHERHVRIHEISEQRMFAMVGERDKLAAMVAELEAERDSTKLCDGCGKSLFLRCLFCP